MEAVTNPEIQNLPPITPQNNIFKILFFIFLALFLTISIILVVYLVKNNQKQPELITKDEQTQTVSSITPTETVISPTLTISEETNILKISDIKMELPKNWKVYSVSGNNAKILTDYSKYQVYLTLKLNKNDSIAESSYKSAVTKTKIDYGEVFDVAQGGAKGVTGAVIDGNKYSFEWNIESNQPVPTNLDGIWRPDDNVTSKILLDITKTVKPITEISSIPKDWKTYTNSTYKYSIQYPSDWILNKTSNELVYLLTKERDQYLKSGKIGPLSDLSIKVYKNISLLENNDKSLGLYDWLKQEESKNLIYNIKSLNYWSTPAYQVTSRGESDSEGIYIQKNNFIYSISVASEKISEVNQSIINTLKFN